MKYIKNYERTDNTEFPHIIIIKDLSILNTITLLRIDYIKGERATYKTILFYKNYKIYYPNHNFENYKISWTYNTVQQVSLYKSDDMIESINMLPKIEKSIKYNL